MAKLTPERVKAMARRPRVASAYIRGEPQASIAQREGVDQGTISRDLKAIHRDWVKNTTFNLDKEKALVLAKLDELERAAWHGWELSLKDAERQKISTGEEAGKDGKKKPKGARIEKVTEGQGGNARFLEVILNCVKRRCELLGLDAPKRTEISGPAGDPVPLMILEAVNPHTRTEKPSGSLLGPVKEK